MALVTLGLVAAAVPVAAASPAKYSRLSFSRNESLSCATTSSLSVVVPVAAASPAKYSQSLDVYCGRGDKKTAKGKRFRHSFGNARPRDKNKGRGPPRISTPPAPPRKDKYDDGEVVKIEIDESLFN